MKVATVLRGLLGCLVVLAIGVPASAAITLYDQEGMKFSTDGSFNTFYVYSDSNKNAAMEATGAIDRQQSRVKMGFLPNWIGFNFSKNVGDTTYGGRSSFWVTINDSDDAGKATNTAIDVRQFYGTVDAGWGQILFGKDFTLFSRSNIFLDEILAGYGNVSDTLGLIDGGGVSFGNIGTGYTYPLPSAQITYRTPVLSGFRLAVGIIDPSRVDAGGEETMPRFEGELTYNLGFEGGGVTAWTGFLSQKSESAAGDVNSRGFSYGVQGKIAGLSLTASGFDAQGVGLLIGPGFDTALGLVHVAGDEIDSDGYLLQASYTFGPSRLVASHGQTEVDASPAKWENETTTGAYFHTVNDYLKLVAEYNVNKFDIGPARETTKTIALGMILNF